ncbi:flagellar hook-basal body complex protein FliE [Phenylobacterium zucineum HLK1]|uniref:Flagellar hook-basal body complex protein FliE n=1 Tax=Phenylobacterium zucineum (strain HLK1) TaxID=450851 RepID=B4RGX4_PHEZH|nr:flagellar hook-basal body complex protein FliE [Phenylobacterium zucineum]ACG77340.1 flagellar hook-basal body complex protein FliE [Phenylobacterium zucineum HLK1]
MITPLAAAKAYAAAQKTMGLEGAGGVTEPGAGPGFGEILKAAMGDAIQASRQAETQMAAQVQGKAELVDVVTAISAAEASLETVLAVRDQVISAYKEILQMPI